MLTKLHIVAVILAAAAAAGCDRPSTHASAALERGGANPTRAPSALSSASADRGDPLVSPLPSQKLPPRDVLSDPAITARITAAIVTDPAMAGADVSVNTDNRVVSLVGTVRSQEQTAIASAHAQSQDGVMRVDNHLSFNLR